MNWYFASGDLDFFWQEQLRALKWLPQVFRPDLGFGTTTLLNLWIDYPFRFVLKFFSTIGVSWFVIDKLLWLCVFGLAIYSSYLLGKYIFGKGLWAVFTAIIYATNTYMLLLFSGGQLGVALAYGYTPFVIYRYVESIDSKKKFTIRQAMILGLMLALLVVFDLRLAYLSVGAITLYLILRKKFIFLYTFGLSLLTAGSVHLFWILPTILTGTGPESLGQDFVNASMLKFLSVADFSHALALLHPNWPENLFGKVYFLQPEFLVLPILAFIGLFFLKSKRIHTGHVFFFAIIGMLGAFFAKGVNDPFGGIFQWMFSHVPGFVMFRDPTKFYLYTAMSYAILIPFALRELAGRVKKLSWIVPTVFTVFWLFTIRAVFLGTVAGNFKPVPLPAEYVQLKNVMVADASPSRSLWIPSKEKFAYSSGVHPILSSEDVFPQASFSAVIAHTKNPSFLDTLSQDGIKYVVVPIDLEHRLFLNDYQFDPGQREALIIALSNTALIRNTSFRDIAVFENPSFTMHAEEPTLALRQQQVATIGFYISVVCFIIIITIILWIKS